MDSDALNDCTVTGLDAYPLGYTLDENQSIFRLFAPKADTVTLLIFKQFEDDNGLEFPMESNEEGVWQVLIQDTFIDQWYGYKLDGPDSAFFMSTDEVIADPHSRHVTSINHYLQYPKTKITSEIPFDWEGDDFTGPEDPRDLIIYETHIKDMVGHPSSKHASKGVYNDFREAQVGGIQHLKEMGVNAVEFLPLQKFAYFEPPFFNETPEGIKNVWNPYARNYWGYMTSFHYAPETLYSSSSSLERESVVGRSTEAETELKELIKALHKEEMTVIMDVVYNHASHYDLNPLKYTAKEPYFRLDEKGNFLNDSWTGNDINTQAKYARELIVESIKHWMTEYHIDGFRFDLAGLIDWETVDQIREEAKKINPNVILIAEPWGGNYCPDQYSDHDWASWNDRLRNDIKGYNPLEDKGFIFGHINKHLSRYGLENLIRGTLRSGEHGLFQHSGHSVNYLESHDGYTLGDYIRLVLDPAKAEKKFTDMSQITPLSEPELKIAKLAAITLFVTQGITMIHAGQEWARSKVIRDPQGIDPNKGKIDRDTYNKDDETNWLNFDEIGMNAELYAYYKGLIELRLSSPALRKAQPEEIEFKVYQDRLHVTFFIDGKSSGDMYNYFVSLNASPDQDHDIVLPKGYWELVTNAQKSGSKTIISKEQAITVPASSGIVLRKLRVSKA